MLHDKLVRPGPLPPLPEEETKARLTAGYTYVRQLVRGAGFSSGSVGLRGTGPAERQLKLSLVGGSQYQASCPLSQGRCGRGGNCHQKPGARGKQGCQEMNPTQGPSSWPALCH